MKKARSFGAAVRDLHPQSREEGPRLDFNPRRQRARLAMALSQHPEGEVWMPRCLTAPMTAAFSGDL